MFAREGACNYLRNTRWLLHIADAIFLPFGRGSVSNRRGVGGLGRLMRFWRGHRQAV